MMYILKHAIGLIDSVVRAGVEPLDDALWVVHFVSLRFGIFFLGMALSLPPCLPGMGAARMGPGRHTFYLISYTFRI